MNLDSELDLSGPELEPGVPAQGYQTDDPQPNDDDVAGDQASPVDASLETDLSTDEGEGAE